MRSQTPVADYLTNWGNAVTYWEAGPPNELAGIELLVAWKSQPVAQATSFAFSLASLDLEWDSKVGGGMLASVTATVFAFVSSLLEFKASSCALAEATAGLGIMDAVIVGLDTASPIWDTTYLPAGN
jgi:hypothetical protein